MKCPPHLWTEIPALPGSYALILHLARPQTARVGQLGYFAFPAGTYAYFGSARGSGGLRARVSHHLKSSAIPHWHLDWLRPHCEAVAVVFRLGGESLECSWAQKILPLPGVGVIAPGFGSRDCRSGCPAHLLYLIAPLEPLWLGEYLGADGVVIRDESGLRS
jgi:Uri superfamily endonuclease